MQFRAGLVEGQSVLLKPGGEFRRILRQDLPIECECAGASPGSASSPVQLQDVRLNGQRELVF